MVKFNQKSMTSESKNVIIKDVEEVFEFDTSISWNQQVVTQKSDQHKTDVN